MGMKDQFQEKSRKAQDQAKEKLGQARDKAGQRGQQQRDHQPERDQRDSGAMRDPMRDMEDRYDPDHSA